MANHMREVAQMLGVEVGEIFQLDAPSLKNRVFRFVGNDLQVSVANDGNYNWGVALECRLLGLLRGYVSIIKLPWKPQINEKYYVPYITCDEKEMYYSDTWVGSDDDMKCYRMGLVCKTKEEAIALTKKMLVVAKEV